MIKFKVFDVGDIHYEEQIEQFQKEHQNAEFVQITGGYTSYEKIWFKYDDSIEQSELNENQKTVLNRLKNEGNTGSPIGAVSVMMGELEKNLPLYYALSSLKRKEHAQIIRTFAEWVIEQEENKWNFTKLRTLIMH